MLCYNIRSLVGIVQQVSHELSPRSGFALTKSFNRRWASTQATTENASNDEAEKKELNQSVDKDATDSKSATEEESKPKDIAPTMNVMDSLLNERLKKSFVKSINDTFTPVQQQCINAYQSSKTGIVVRAKTGTGKTLAFGVPILNRLFAKGDPKKNRNNKYVHSVIFSPTRDLASQTVGALSTVWRNATSAPSRSNIALIMGQTPRYENLRPFRQHRNIPRIIVATPGRFADLLNSESEFNDAFGHLQNVVIDEADELLNSNFREDMIDIVQKLQAKTSSSADSENSLKTMLFSATINNDVYKLAQKALGEKFPFIDIDDGGVEINENITQKLVKTKSIFESYASAAKFIKEHAEDKKFRAIVFVSTTVGVDAVYQMINDVVGQQLPIFELHGKLTQGKRRSQQKAFRINRSGVLVASNVAARGMDFPDVTHVIQIGISPEIESHTHRIGRTGRAGKKGEAILITTKTELPYVGALKDQGNKFVEEKEYEPDEEFESKLRSYTKNYDAGALIHTYLSAYASVPKNVANMRHDKIVADCSLFYQDLKGEYEEKPTLSGSAASKVGFDSRIMRKFFNIVGGSTGGSWRRNGGDHRRSRHYDNKRNNYSRRSTRNDFGSRSKSGYKDYRRVNNNNQRNSTFNRGSSYSRDSSSSRGNSRGNWSNRFDNN